MLGEILGQLEAREVAVCEDPVHDARFLEDEQVPVHGALRERAPMARPQDLGNRQGSRGAVERGDDGLTARGRTLVRRAKPGRHGLVQSVRARGCRRRSAWHRLQSTVEAVNATERFAEIVSRSDDDIPLDIAALLIAAHAHPSLELAEPVTELDRLAGTVQGEDAAAVVDALFRPGGFAGNTEDYGDPRNSFLDDVLARRLGIPISLSVVTMEVGRRLGIPIRGVGMPGHFLVRGEDEGVWFDPFHGGRRLDEAGCRALFESVRGAGPPFDVRFLAPVGARVILNRMLANLQHSYTARAPASIAWVARLRLSIPGLTLAEKRDIATALGAAGRFVDAARALDALTAHAPEAQATRLAREAAAYRARAN